MPIPGGGSVTAITKARMRAAGIAAGIPADVVDKMLGPGVRLSSSNPRVILRLVVDDGDTFLDPDKLADKPERLGTMGCTDSYCDGPAGHDGQHYQWVPE